MPEPGPVAWPPAPMKTGRLVLRAPKIRDRTAFIELFASPEVRTCIGTSSTLAASAKMPVGGGELFC